MTLSHSNDHIQCAVDCAKDSDTIMLSNNGTIQPENTIIINKSITMSGFHEEVDMFDDTYPAAKKKTVITCPKNTTQGIFNIKSGGVIIANLKIRDCLNPENASPVVIGECEGRDEAGVQIHHVDFVNNSGRSHPVAIDTLPGPTSCGALEITDILFQGNKAGNEAVFVRLQFKTIMKDIRLKSNQPEDVNEQRNRFFLFTSTQKENDSLSIDNLDAIQNSVPIIEARVGIVNILRSVFKKNKVNMEDKEIKLDASMIHFSSASKVTIRDCLFNENGGKGQGLILGDNVSSIEIHESTFSRNSEFGSAIFSSDSILNISGSNFVSNNGTISGGVLHLENSNAKITNSTFSDNMSDESGGAVYAFKDSNIRVRGSRFEKNQAREGGCFHIEESDVSILKSSFKQNEAKIDGGAIRLQRGGLRCRHSTFTHNTVLDNGGAFNIESATYVNWEDVHFRYNRATVGSSVRIVRCKNNVLWKDVDFQNSTVGLTGAAAYIDDSNVIVDGAIFQNLIAPNGGALYAQSFNITIKNALFKNNHARVMGGAISGEIGTITFKNVTFIENNSMLGGALHFYNSTFIASDISFEKNTAFDGAALLFKDSNVSIGPWPGVKGNISASGVAQSNLSFGIYASRNEGMESGGVLTAIDTNVIISYGAFVENRALEGGAIQVTSAKGNSFNITNSLFDGSVADVRGGGIAARASDGELSVKLTTVNFTECISDQGGAIFFTSVNTVIDNCSFLSNTAANGGAAVFQKNKTVLSNEQNFTNRPHTQDVNIYLKDCVFKDNKAGTDGGAIKLIGELIADRQYIMNKDTSQAFKYADYGFNVTIKSVKFCKNRSYSKGGAIYGKSVNLTIHDVNIKKNNATEGGGVFFIQSNFTVLNSKVIMNQAENGGGGIKVTQESNSTIFSTMISGNQITKEGEGGGLSISGCTVKGQGLYVKGNSATLGGGVNVAHFTERDSIVKRHVADSRFLCLNCTFVDNKASTSGGGMNIEYQDTNSTVIAQLEKCSFEYNSAKVFGGGIHFRGPDNHIKCEHWTANGYVVILSSTFTINAAGRSGGSLISYDRHKVLAECTSSMENRLDLNFINETRLKVLFQNQSGYCPQWKNEENEKNVSAVSSYVANCTASMVKDDNDENGLDTQTGNRHIYETIPGRRLPSILVNCYDEFGNIFKSDSNGFTATLKSKKEKDRQQIFVTNLTDGIGNFTDLRTPANGDTFNGSYIYELEISFSLEYVPLITVDVYVRACRINEQKEIEGVLCKPCDATQYNFDPMNKTCKSCDDTLNCSGTFVRPSENYWHASPCHVPAKKCLTAYACEGAIDVEEKIHDNEFKNIRDTISNYSCKISEVARKEYHKLLCKEGYEGVLCGSCEPNYVRSMSFECTKCHSTGFSILILGFVCAWLALIAGIAIKGSITFEDHILGLKKQLIDLAARNPHPIIESLPEEVTENVSAKMLKNKKDEEVEDKTIEASSSTRKCHKRMISGLSRATNSSYWVDKNLPIDAEEEANIDTHERINNLRLAQLAGWKLSEVCKVTINFLQAIGLAAAINAKWTRYMLGLFDWSAVVGGLSTALVTKASQCFPWWKNTKRASYVSLVSGFLVPIFVILCIVAFFAFVTYKSSKGMYYFVKRSVLAALAICYLSYLSITRVAVMFFYCVGVHTNEEFSSNEETYYWALDTSIQCSASYHKKFMVFGGILFGLFSVGFPLISAAVLVLFRKDSGHDDPQWMADILGFLYRAYRREFVYWESIVLLRKALLSVIAVFSYHLGRYTQGLLASSILSVCLFFQTICKPYRHEFETVNNQESRSLLVSGITFTLAQFFMKDKANQTVKVSLSVLLMITIIGFTSYMVVSIAICYYDIIKTHLKLAGVLTDDDKSSWGVISAWVASRLCFNERLIDDNNDIDVEMGATRREKPTVDDDM
eukprot:g7133.t1